MDAGEGALGQMTRLWSARGATAHAAALAAVLVSHKHADHVLGIPALLAARPRGSPPLVIVGAHHRPQRLQLRATLPWCRVLSDMSGESGPLSWRSLSCKVRMSMS